ncbi:IPT/TIG domain-containing protein [Hymenobacter sp. BRD67]|uniref:IPT/TIG domain-containing protein n=1 Tax=Hymenobacter sp. BRD67 TaxID=2675877 RepID=UPI001567025F|nr:IPT/TIG domain-containing protein [Hymenobacter sp. BRD67]QKG51854.1 IPT/TIG domain-containing protein [Hymenobacter sp. BRD67]
MVAGYFSGTAAFGSTTFSSAGGTDGFVARLSADGSWLGAARAGGPRADQFAGLAVQADGTAFVTGNFIQSATFGSLPALATASGRSTYDTDILIASLSSTNTWQWAMRAGSTNPDAGRGIVVDAAGRVSVTGSFRDSVDFAPQSRLYARSGTPGVLSGQDIFVAQLDAATGTWQWATRAGGVNFDASQALAGDASGNLYLGGYFRNVIDFGDSLALPTLTARGGIDALLASLSADGTWRWATQAGVTASGGGTNPPDGISDQALTVTVDPAGTRVSVGGILGLGPKAFGPAATLLLPGPSAHGFVAQAAGATGTWLNAVTLPASGYPQDVRGLSVGLDGSLYPTGQFTNTLLFGTEQRASAYDRVPVSNGEFANSQSSVYAARLDPDAGAWTQALRTDNGGNLTISATTHDAAGNTYVTGAFDGNMVLATPVPTRLVNAGSFNVFVGKLDPVGNWLWAVAGVEAGYSNGYGLPSECGTGIAVDAAGRVTVTGFFKGHNITFGSLSAPGTPGTASTHLTIVDNVASNDTFVAQLDAATGTPRWVTSLAGTGDNQPFSLCRDPATDDLVLAGTFSGSLAASSGGSLTATATGQYDGFLARISAAGQWQWLRQAGGAGIGNNVAYNNLLFNSVQQDGTGAYVVGGMVQGTAQLGSLNLTGCPVVNYYYPFVARLDASATTWQWQYVEGNANAYVSFDAGYLHAAAVDAAGNVYAPALGGTYLLRRLSASGTLLQSIAVPNAQIQPNYTYIPAADAAGGMVVAGTYTAPATFGSTTLPGSGRFVARLDGSGNWSWAGPVNTAPLGHLEVVDAGGTMTAVGLYEPTSRPSSQPFVVARLLPPPSITSFTPGSGNSGDQVTLTGLGFTDAATVAFNGTNAPGFVVSNGGTTITVTVPIGATTGPITVTSVGARAPRLRHSLF